MGPLGQLDIQFALGADRRVRSVRGDVAQMLGYSADDLLSGRVDLRDRFHEGDRAVADLVFSPLFEGASEPLPVRIRGADGRIRCLKAHARKNAGPTGEVILDLVLEDPRSLREPEDAALAASFATLIEHTRDIIYVKDRNHVLLAASRALANLTESAQSAADLVGKTDYDLFPEALADISYRNEAIAYAEGRRMNEVVQAADQSGQRVWLDDRKYPLNDAKGNPAGIFGIAPDLTAYVEAERGLRESEEALQEAQRIAGVGSYVLDVASSTWRPSDSLYELLGIGRDFDRSVEGLRSLVPEEDWERVNALIEEATARGDQSYEVEHRIVRPRDGAMRWIRVRGRLEYEAAGKLRTVRVTFQDITENKQTELELRESKELLQLFIENAPAPLAMFDRDMRYLAVSRRWLEKYPFMGDNIVGKLSYDIFTSMPERWRVEHQRALTGETIRVEEDAYETPDGKPQWARRELRPWYTGDGQVGGILIFSEDITDRKRAETGLRESRELLRIFIEHAPVALAMFDLEMRYVAVSRRWMEVHDFAGREITGLSHYEVFPGLPENWIAAHRRALAGEPVRTAAEPLLRENGKVQWLRRELRPWYAGDGRIGGIIIFTEDVTEDRKERERQRLAETVFNHAGEGITISDAAGHILEVNPAFTRITGYTREEVLGKNPRILQSGIQTPAFYENMWQSLLKGGQWSGEIWNKTKCGEIIAEELTITAVHDAVGKVVEYVAIFSDVTRVKEQERQLEHVAHYDALTGLPNRSLLSDRLRQAMAQARRRNQFLAVAYLDLDGFKVINDRYGQETGDSLLTAIAKRVTEALREGDSLGRLGGDEFAAVILDLPDAAAVLPILDRLLQAVSKPVRLGARDLRVTASIGVAIYPAPDDPDADQLLRQGGQAMYQAKLAGRHRYAIFDPGEDLNVRVRSQELERILHAIANREFVLHYQPKVNMRSGAVVGAEALIRWQHPTRGLLPPGQFLPILENHPLSIELGEWVIDTALAQIEAWQEMGLDLPVSVNVGALQLQQKDFSERLRRLLAAHPRVKPDKLELEVLETSALQDLAQTSSVLEACRDLGVTVAIDDFGTGYASLTYLKRLPVQTLKIDQSFVRDILDDPEDLSILEAVLGLATAFRRGFVAEGVETIEHGLMLLYLGCELAQGYGIARPMPAVELPQWLASWRPNPRWITAPAVHSGNRLLLFATVEHRVWLGAFESYLQGKRLTPPPLDPRDCRFAAWLDAEQQAGRANQPTFQAIELLHEQLHGLAEDILRSQAGGPCSEGLARLAMLHHMRDQFLNSLSSLN